jgi:LysR family transcriptional regulator, regulator for genes of the gallate degradation pathway
MAHEINVSLRHLLAFQMVAKLRNIRKAAEAVYLTQPAISLAVAKLETQAGAVLFDRTSSGTFLTPSGKLFGRRIDRMFAQIGAAFAAAGIDADRANSFAALSIRMTRAQIRALAALAGSHIDDGEHDVSRASTLRAARELERVLGTELVRQEAGGPVVTGTGKLLAERLTVALREVDYGIEDIAAEAGRECGQMRIGAMPLSGSFLLAPVLDHLATAYPEARFEVTSGDRGQLTRALLAGEIDLIVGLCESDQAEGLVAEALARFPYVLVARPSHPLAGRRKIAPAELEGYDWVAPNARTARRMAFDWLVGQMASAPAGNVQASSLSTVQILLSGSDRLALLTRFEFEQQRASGGLVDLAIGPIEPTHAIGIMRRANWEPTALHRRFIELLRAHADRIGGSDSQRQRSVA